MPRVRFEVGPVLTDLAIEWLTNSRALVRSVATRRDVVTVRVSDAVLELIDAYLSTWLAACEQDPSAFTWAADVDVSDVQVLADHWTALAALTDDECLALDWTWAPPRTAPMYEALVAGVVTALRDDPGTTPHGDRFAERPPGTRGSE